MHFLLYGATLVMLTTNLMGYTHIAWWLVFAPSLVPIVTFVFVLVFAFIIALIGAIVNK